MNRNATAGEAHDGPSPLLRFDPSELPLRFAAALNRSMTPARCSCAPTTAISNASSAAM